MNKIGIAIRKNSGEFKDFNVVLSQLHDKWASMNDVQKNAIVGSLAGTRQREQLLTLMEHWDTYETLLDKEKESAGNAQKIFDAGFGTSTQAKINDLKNAMQKLWMTLIDSKAINMFVGAITKLVEGITKFAEATDSSVVAITGIGLAIGGVLKLFTSLLTGFSLLKGAMMGTAIAGEVATVGGAVATAGANVGIFGGLLSKLPLLLTPTALGIVGATAGVLVLADAFKTAHDQGKTLSEMNFGGMKLHGLGDAENPDPSKPAIQNKSSLPHVLPSDYGKDAKVTAQTDVALYVSKNAKEAMDAYMKLDQQSATELLKMKTNNTKITQEMATNVDTIYEQMGSMVKQNLDKQYSENNTAFTNIVNSTSNFSEKEKQEILKKSSDWTNGKKQIVDNALKTISDIQNRAVAEGRQLNQDEYTAIENASQQIREVQVSSVSKSANEQKAILEELNVSTKELKLDEAKTVIQTSQEKRDATIKSAKEECEKTIALIQQKRDVEGVLNEEEAKKAIEEAVKKRDEQIESAKTTHREVVSQVEGQCTDVKRVLDDNGNLITGSWLQTISWFVTHPLKLLVDSSALSQIPSYTGEGIGKTDVNQNPSGKLNFDNANALEGTVGAKKGNTLVGEEGIELVISKDGKYHTLVGVHGAEIVAMEGGETVIPHGETEKILGRNSSVSGRAYASGTDNYPDGTRIQTTETGGIIEGEGFFPNLFGEKPSSSSSSKSSSSSTKKTYNPNHFDFSSTVDVDKTQLEADIRDLDNLTKAITNLDKLTKVYKDSKNFDEALKTNGMSIDTLNQKMNSLKIGYQNTLITKDQIGAKIMTEFTGLFKGKDLDAMTKPEFEALYNQAYGTEKTGLSESEKNALQNQSKALKQLTDDWFKAKDQLDDISQQELDTQTSITEAIKNKWDIVFATKDAEITNFDKQIDTLKHQMNSLDEFDYTGRLTIQQQISDLDISRLSTLQSITNELQEQLDSGRLTANEWDIVNNKVTTYKNTIADAEQTLRQNYNDMKSIVNNLEGSIESLANQISNAYKEMYEAQKKAQIDPLNDDINAIEKQIQDLQNEEDDKKKQRDAIQQQYNDVLNDNSVYGKAKQQELKSALDKLNKEIKITDLEDEKKDKQDKINDIEQEFSTLLDDSNLYKQASEMILEGDSKKISNFLTTNLPEFQRKQTLFGDQWINVFNEETTKNLDQLKNIGTLLTTLNDYQNKLNTFFTGTTTTTTTSGGLAKQTVWVTGTGTADYASAQAYADKLGWTIKVINGTNYNQVQSGDRLVGYAGTLYGNKTSGTMVTGADRTETQTKVNTDVANLLNQLAKSTTTTSNSSGNTFVNSIANAVAGKIASTNAVVSTPVVNSGSSGSSTSSYTKNGTTYSTTTQDSTSGLHTTYGGSSSSSSSSSSNSSSSSGHGLSTSITVSGNTTTYHYADGYTRTEKYDTGGETGSWDNNDGKLAFLHKKERVLSAEQTKAFNELVYNTIPNLLNSESLNFNNQNLGQYLKNTFNLNQPLIKNEITNNNYTPFDNEGAMNNLERILKRQIGNKLGYIG